MIPKKMRSPTHTNANAFKRVIIPDSAEERMCVRSVAGIVKRASGRSEYPVAIMISLMLPSPSNSVVIHQLAVAKSATGIPIAAICIPKLWNSPVGLYM